MGYNWVIFPNGSGIGSKFDIGEKPDVILYTYIIRRVRGQGNIHFPCSQLTTSRIGNLTRLIHTLTVCHDHIYNRHAGTYFCVVV